MENDLGDRTPVSILNRRKVLENAVWTVFLDHIRSDTGHEVQDYLVVQPNVRVLGNVGGVGVLPILDGKIVLRRAYRYPLETFVWEIPRGFVDPGEDPKVSALRELEEEAGLVCDADDLLFLGAVSAEASTIAGVDNIYLGLNCRKGGVRDVEEMGLGECHVFTPDEISSMIAANEVTEAHTQVALCRYLLQLAS
jgi:ADP-ribose pyrophosphatase